MAAIKFRPGFLDRLERSHGFQTDTALAGAIGVTPSTLSKARKSGVASPQILAGIAQAFGYGLGEIAYVDNDANPTPEADEAPAADHSKIAA